MRASAQEVTANLERLNRRWAEEADAQDNAVLAAINRAISLQEGDNDSPSDSKVMSLLREAKAAQEQDLKEEDD